MFVGLLCLCLFGCGVDGVSRSLIVLSFCLCWLLCLFPCLFSCWVGLCLYWFVDVLVCWRLLSVVLLCHCVLLFSVVLFSVVLFYVVLFSVVLVCCCCVGASNDTAAVAVAMLLAVFAQPRSGRMKTAALIRA